MWMIHEVMYAFSRWVGVVGVLVLPMLGCSDTSVGAAGGSGGSGSAGSGGTAGSGGSRGPETVTMLTTTYEVLPDRTVRPLSGVRVCEIDTHNCATSNEDGRVALDFPANQETGYTAEKAGHISYLTTFVTDETFPRESGEAMFTEAQLEALANQVEVPYPWTGGLLGVATRPALADATFDLVGAAGTTPFYLDETQHYSYELDATLALEPFPGPLGVGGFAGLAEGEYVVEFSGTAADCNQHRWGWRSDAPNRVRVPVRVGYISYASLGCPEP